MEMWGGHFSPVRVVNLNRRRVVNMSGFCTTTASIYEIKKIDTDYFHEE